MTKTDEELQKEQLEKERTLKLAYLNTFSTFDGKIVLDDLRKRCFIKSTTFTGEPYSTIFNEGTRSIILHIEDAMDMDSDEIKVKEQSDAGSQAE